MAFIVSLDPLPALHGSRPHSMSEGTWRISSREGSRVLQIDSYGSTNRQDVGTISQSLQLDAERAAQLVTIIRATFPEID